MKPFLIFSFVTFFISIVSLAQDSLLSKIPLQYIDAVHKKTITASVKVSAELNSTVRRFWLVEQRVYRKLKKRDSVAAKEFLSEAKLKYDQLQKSLAEGSVKSKYLPALDTISTSLSFLKNQEAASAIKESNEKLAAALSSVSSLKYSLGKADLVKSFLNARKEELTEKMGSLSMGKDVKRLNKELYYYSAQIKEYKEILKDKKKVEKKALQILTGSKLFKDFARNNSELAKMFRLPGEPDLGNNISIEGLQSRAAVNSLIRERIGAGGPDGMKIFKENMQAAQAQLNSLRSKLSQYNAGASEVPVPVNFKPNSQKTKSFGKRIEIGTNIQTQKARQFFPVTTDLGVSLGYKLTDLGTVGLGTSYKLGLGTGWDNLQFTHQGIGLRAYVDYQIKGNIFMYGGYERNYRSAFQSVLELKEYRSWQSSGLIGVSKKYKINAKFNGTAQLLWDFLSYYQQPRTQSILFRVGYVLPRK